MKNLKTLLFFAFIVFFFESTYAQNLKFAIVAEPHLSWMKPDVINVESDGIKPGIKYGLNMERYFQENYAFATGLLINNTGGNLQYNDTIFFRIGSEIDTLSPGDVVEYELQYIEIPLALKFTTNQIGYFKYFAQVGLNAQIKIKANADIENLDAQNVKIPDEVNLFNAGYHIGGGIHYSLGGSAAITAALIFTNGFVDVTSKQEGDKTNPSVPARLEDKAILNSLSLKVGIVF